MNTIFGGRRRSHALLVGLPALLLASALGEPLGGATRSRKLPSEPVESGDRFGSEGNVDTARAEARLALSRVEHVARSSVWLSTQLAASDDGWVRPDPTSHDLVSARYAEGGLGGVAATAPRFANGPRWVGLGRSRRYGVSLTLEGAREVDARLDRGRLVYVDALPSTDVVLSTNPFAFDEAWFLKDPSAPTHFSWRVDRAAGVHDATLTASGGLVFRDRLGRGVLEIPRPFAVDAQGQQRFASLSWDGQRVHVDLAAKGLVYPVLLDPGLVEVATWTLKTATSFGAPRAGSAMAYDPTSHNLVLVGGFAYMAGLGQFIEGGLYTWSGGAWTSPVCPGTQPYAGLGQLVHVPGLGGLLAWGGHYLGGDVSGPQPPRLLVTTPQCSWTNPSLLGTLPEGRSGHALVVIPERNHVFGVGGGPRVAPGNVLPDRAGVDLAPNPVGWVSTSQEPGYTPVRDSAVVYLPPTGALPSRVLVQGGRTCMTDMVTAPCDAPVASQMYSYGTNAWGAVPSAGEPMPARWGTSVAWDATRNRAVFFGGRDAAGLGADTYEFTGTRWYRRQIAGPSPRTFASMAYVPDTQETILVGGATGLLELDDPQNSALSNETWSYSVTSAACSTDNECDTGHCVDGACCEVAACAPCHTCGSALDPGYCVPIEGEADPDSCSFVCLAGGVCPGDQGSGCSTGDDCTTGLSAGQCVDGVCCTAPSCQACETCNGSTPGLCTAVLSADDPDSCTTTCDAQGACGLYPQGHECTDPTTCITAICTAGICCDSACTGACSTCETGTCSPIAFGASPLTTCNGKLCDGMSLDCPATCEVAGCAYAGLPGVCGPTGECLNPQGSECTTTDQCQSGFCVDGFCCNSDCSGECVACVGAMGNGTCQPIPAGQPDPDCNPRFACDGNGGVCLTQCFQDSDCVDPYICDLTTLQCVEGQKKGFTIACEPQNASAECPEGWKCVGSFCEPERTPSSEVCAPPNIRNSAGVCTSPAGAIDPASPQGCLCTTPGSTQTQAPGPLVSIGIALVALGLARRKRNATLATSASAAALLLTQACNPIYEMPAEEPCRNAGFSIASRVQGCTGDADHANHLYEQFTSSYSCLVSQATIENFVCSDQILQISCDQVKTNGDSLDLWLSSKECASILAPRNAIGASKTSDNPACLQIFDFVRQELALCLSPNQNGFPVGTPDLATFDETYTCLAPLQAGNPQGPSLTTCATDLTNLPCANRSFDEWIADTPSCATVIEKNKATGTAGASGAGGTGGAP